MAAFDEKFGAAFIDGGVRHRLLGVDLEPFSLWHLFLHQAINSPFLRRGDVGWFELRTAVGIGRLRYPDSRIVRPRVWLRRGFLKKVTTYLAYTGDYLAKPDYSIVPRPVKPGSPAAEDRGMAPEVIRQIWDIVGWSHCGFAEAWNMPVGQAHVWQLGARRARGEDIDVMTPEDRQREAELHAAGIKPWQPGQAPPETEQPSAEIKAPEGNGNGSV